MTDYLALLEHSYHWADRNTAPSRLEYLSELIFDFTTYDGEMAALFATKALEVCEAITEKKTFEYIKDPERYRWYLLMCNMPFFADKLTWGTSIRGAWWDWDIELETCGLWVDDEQVTNWQFKEDEWDAFMRAMLQFAHGERYARAL